MTEDEMRKLALEVYHETMDMLTAKSGGDMTRVEAKRVQAYLLGISVVAGTMIRGFPEDSHRDVLQEFTESVVAAMQVRVGRSLQ